MEKIIIFGGSGFIGRHLIKILENDYKVIVISRHHKSNAKLLSNNVIVERHRTRDLTKLIDFFEGAKAIINLAGENVGERWTTKKMDRIKKSRLDIDNIIIRATRGTTKVPEVIIQGSSIGIYGLSRNTIDVTEETPNGQRGFLSKVAVSHEETFHQLEKLSRVVYIRTGLVLDKYEGSLPKMASSFQLFLGGKLGDGNQWNSWIHIDDEVRAIKYLIENENARGPYNLTAPNPINQTEMAKKIGISLGKPSFFTKPSFFIKILYGAMADELLLNGVKVVPEKLIDEGFEFKYTNIDDALKNIYDLMH